jgi:hypothetical protein
LSFVQGGWLSASLKLVHQTVLVSGQMTVSTFHTVFVNEANKVPEVGNNQMVVVRLMNINDPPTFNPDAFALHGIKKQKCLPSQTRWWNEKISLDVGWSKSVLLYLNVFME